MDGFLQKLFGKNGSSPFKPIGAASTGDVLIQNDEGNDVDRVVGATTTTTTTTSAPTIIATATATATSAPTIIAAMADAAAVGVPTLTCTTTDSTDSTTAVTPGFTFGGGYGLDVEGMDLDAGTISGKKTKGRRASDVFGAKYGKSTEEFHDVCRNLHQDDVQKDNDDDDEEEDDDRKTKTYILQNNKSNHILQAPLYLHRCNKKGISTDQAPIEFAMRLLFLDAKVGDVFYLSGGPDKGYKPYHLIQTGEIYYINITEDDIDFHSLDRAADPAFVIPEDLCEEF